jgi:hypothetical protein
MKPVYAFILLLFNGLSVWSQTDRLDSLLNDVLGDDREIMKFINPPSSYCYLYGGIAGDNKTYYAGREFGGDIYSAYGNLYFFHSKGIFIGASGSWYSELDPAYNTTILSAGINTPLNVKKSLLFKASYSKYLYHNSDSDTGSAYTNNLSTTLSLRNNWIGGRLSVNILFGEDFGMNIIPGIFSRITLVKFGKYNRIKLEPEVSAFFGSETIEYEIVTGGHNPDSQSSYATEDAYSLLNIIFTIPVCIYLGDFDFELGYSVNMPATQDEYVSYPVSSFFSFSIGYLLPLN